MKISGDKAIEWLLILCVLCVSLLIGSCTLNIIYNEWTKP